MGAWLSGETSRVALLQEEVQSPWKPQAEERDSDWLTASSSSAGEGFMSPVRTDTGSTTRTDLAVRFQKLKAQIHRQLVEGLDLSRLHLLKPDHLRREVRSLATTLTRSTPEAINELDRERLVEEILDEAFGLGPLESLMKDPEVSDILVNGSHEVYVERKGQLELSDVIFADNAHLMQVIQRIAARVGRRVDEMSPIVDARLPDGSRVNAIVPPLALNGPVLSIRRFGVHLDAVDLLKNGSMQEEVLYFLAGIVEARLNLLISGGAGSGKTTLLNILSAFIPKSDRLVTIEDAAELQLQRPHVVRLETRPGNVEGVGEIRQRELVRNSLRMRPDRIIIGEVRGAEALDMLQAMNTGHEGSMTTIHANDTRDALARLEGMVMLVGAELPMAVVRQYVAGALSVVVHLARLKGGTRRVMRVSEIVGIHPKRGTYVLKDVFGFRQLGIRDGRAHGEYYATGHVPRFLPKMRAMGVDVSEELFIKRAIPEDPVGKTPEPNKDLE
jgi:pilus assembly protein CpaF